MRIFYLQLLFSATLFIGLEQNLSCLLKFVPSPVIALSYVMMISWFSYIRLLFIFEEFACSHMCIIITTTTTTTTILCNIRPGETCYGYYKTEYYHNFKVVP
jgi:hypothetical protein